MAAYAALVSLMHIIDQIQLHPRPPIFLQQKQIQLLTTNATFLEEFLKDYNPSVIYNTEADPLETRIADVAHTAEDLIESHIVDNITNHGSAITSAGLDQALEKVIEDMDCIMKEAMEIKETMGVQQELQRISMTPSSLRCSSMVGVDDVVLELMDKLTGGGVDRQTIPITGMGGIGKTTLASNVFEKPLITGYFDIRAWVTISQQYSIREIFEELLSQLNQGHGGHLSEGELGEKLYKHLSGRRYIIILDDIWSVEAWDGVRMFFPDNKNGSRVLVTTRLSNLASNLTNSNTLEMRFLDEANSWNLLCKTVFGDKGSCPVELEKIGKKITKSCKGLPLSIAVIGGCLAKSTQTKEFWGHMEENLNSIVNLEDNERCLRTLHMSYKHLSVHLKPCFLYMGIFLEDEAIRVSKLIKLWVAEGFIKSITGKLSEDAAREYLKDLVDRNLIMIHEVGSTGNMKYCKIHDLLKDLCLREAEKEKFYVSVRPHTPQAIMNGQRRIVISTGAPKEGVADAMQSGSVARSLIWHHQEILPSLKFRLLRILSISGYRSIEAAHSLENVFELVNSRYLNISITHVEWMSSFALSFYLLWNIQTLIFDVSLGIKAPTAIWDMPQIRHVRFGQLHLPDPPRDRDGIVLGNLQTLMTIKDLNCSEEVVRRIPNIKKLEACGENCHLSNLVCLDKLESFCYYTIPNNDSIESLEFPHSVKKLKLQVGDNQSWEVLLGNIGALPFLEKLILFYGRFEGWRWETTEGQFRSLKCLKVCHSRLGIWTTESSHFPRLERLVLQRPYLDEIPLGLAEIPTLRLIEMKLCRHSAVISAKRIVEEQEALYGEVSLQIQVSVLGGNEVLALLASPNFHVRVF